MFSPNPQGGAVWNKMSEGIFTPIEIISYVRK